MVDYARAVLYASFEDTDTAVTGQVATITGPVLYLPGYSGQGRQIAEATTNLVTNPNFEAGTTGWTTGGANTIAQSSEQAKYGSYSLKCTYSNNNLLANRSIVLTAAAHTYGIWVHVPTDYDGTAVRISFANFAGGIGTNITNIDLSLRDQWQRVIVPNYAPVSGDLSGSIQINIISPPTPGKFIYIDAAQVEAKSYSTPYTDTSRLVSTLRYTNPLNTPAGELSLWWKPAASNTGPTMYFFDEGSLKAYFNATDDKIYLTDGINTISTAALTFSAEIGQDLRFTWSVASGLAIYRNSSLVASGVTYTPPTFGASLWVGSDSAGANQTNGIIDDLAVWVWPPVGVVSSEASLTNAAATKQPVASVSNTERVL